MEQNWPPKHHWVPKVSFKSQTHRDLNPISFRAASSLRWKSQIQQLTGIEICGAKVFQSCQAWHVPSPKMSWRKKSTSSSNSIRQPSWMAMLRRSPRLDRHGNTQLCFKSKNFRFFLEINLQTSERYSIWHLLNETSQESHDLPGNPDPKSLDPRQHRVPSSVNCHVTFGLNNAKVNQDVNAGVTQINHLNVSKLYLHTLIPWPFSDDPCNRSGAYFMPLKPLGRSWRSNTSPPAAICMRPWGVEEWSRRCRCGGCSLRTRPFLLWRLVH